MEYLINIHKENELTSIKAAENTNLAELLKRHKIDLNTACNGQGTCGKCKVSLTPEGPLPPMPEEITLLGMENIQKGMRLACFVYINCNMDIFLTANDSKAKIIEGGILNFSNAPSPMQKRHLLLPKPSLKDQRSNTKRVMDAFLLENPLPLHITKNISDVLRKNDFSVTALTDGDTLITLESGDTRDNLYAAAFDIGTTTIAGYLLDLNSGKTLSISSSLNPQIKYGGDVITRIKHTIDSPSGLLDLQTDLIDALNLLISDLAEDSSINKHSIYKVLFTGNTIMMHFLLGLPSANLAIAPFISVTDNSYSVLATSLNININQAALATILPSVSAYIGADTLCAVLACKMKESPSISLLIDFGTNGEIVLGSSEWLLACSTAAGPAFEAANIRCGVGGISGAIDSFKISPYPVFTTIFDEKPIGICGTGLVDIVAELYSIGILDETGRFVPEAELSSIDSIITQNLTQIDSQPAYKIAKKEDYLLPEDIVITQKDIRELQNAKAAIAAGIQVLIEKSSIKISDISKVYLAGGFGSLINPLNAINIGLIPKELQKRTLSAGNAAGTGAQMCLFSSEAFDDIEKIKNRIQYVELSGNNTFNHYYVESMLFP